MDNIVVNVKGSLTQNGQMEETEFHTTGSLKMRDGNKIISYMGALGGEDFTEITLAQGAVVLKKQERGSQDAAIVVLREKQVYSSFYATPMGGSGSADLSYADSYSGNGKSGECRAGIYHKCSKHTVGQSVTAGVQPTTVRGRLR